MFLSRIRLQNWRSYQDSTFEFKKPTLRKPMYLVGAMNGHGKTSLLVALYLGIFGRYGLRHCEGFGDFTDNQDHYSASIPKFRRNGAPASEPTLIDLTFSPTLKDNGGKVIRVVRQWHFNSNQRLKPGDASESVIIYEGGELIASGLSMELSNERLERLLFPAHIAPAFFFDGEQAQTLINTSGTNGLKKSVEVLFGTKIIDELEKQVKDYIQATHNKIGGKRKSSEKEQQLRSEEKRREQINEHIAHQDKEFSSLNVEKENLDRERKKAREELALVGGDRGTDLAQLSQERSQAESKLSASQGALIECIQRMGIALAVSRLHIAIENRMLAEEERERWEGLRTGTLERADRVLKVALPDPPASDDLLGHLSEDIREKVRLRFSKALTEIYNPPPPDCADSYLLGHVKGEARTIALERLHSVRDYGSDIVRTRVREHQEAALNFEEASVRFDREKDTPRDVEEIKQRLTDYDTQISEAIKRLSVVEADIKKHKSDLHTVNIQIRKLQDEIAMMEPEQKRIAIAERVRVVTCELTDQLRPLALTRLQDLVTSHFTKIADPRYRGGSVTFPEDGQTSPLFRFRDGREQSIDSMSGFERRTFGIAFSLALAEMAGQRVPLIIDTPLGNADSEYRPRLMKALTEVDLDQIIVLTHDQEVTGDVLSGIENSVSQKTLVAFDRERHCSTVHDNAYFGAL